MTPLERVALALRLGRRGQKLLQKREQNPSER